MKETPLLMGPQMALFGICTESESAGRIGAIILNAGLLHHVGPFRLHVILARSLAEAGCPTIRLDQSGKGESPARQGLSLDEALLVDYDDALKELNNRGVHKTILIGLCSGADDALYIARHRDTVAGVALIDGYAARTRRYLFERYSRKLLDIGAWLRAFGRVTRRLASSLSAAEEAGYMDIRNWSSRKEMLAAYERLLQDGVQILATFTHGALDYYNYEGQLAASLQPSSGIDGLKENFYAQSDHLFTIVSQRKRLVDDIVAWVENLVDRQ